MSAEQVALHLKAALPSEWFDSDRASTVDWNPDDLDYPEEPGMKWIETLWPYLQKHFCLNLNRFKGLPIIPICSGQSATLGFLKPESKIIFKAWRGQSLPQNIADSLEEDFDATIFANPAGYVDHPQLNQFIFAPNPVSVLQLLMHVSNVTQLFSELSNKSKDDWREYFSALSSLNANQLTFLRSLPIFKARKVTNSDEEFYTDLANPRMKIEALEISSDPLPDGLPLPEAILSYRSNPTTYVTLFKIQVFSREELILSLLSPASIAKLTSKQRDDLILWTISAQRFYNLPKAHSILRSLNFILCSASQNIYSSPEKLFNTAVEKIQDLFLGESLFPQGAYADPHVVKILRELGLKDKPAYNDIIGSAKLVSTYLSDKTLSTDQAKLKANSVVYWLEKMATEKSLPNSSDWNIQQIPFLEVNVDRPGSYANYPQHLAWAGSTYQVKLFESPTNCRPFEVSGVVSSAMPICAARNLSFQLKNFLGLTNVPLDPMVQHLKNLTELNFTDITYSESQQVKKMTEKVYSEMNKLEDGLLEHIVDRLSGSSWIWNGSGFSTPGEVILDSGELNLKPHLASIPYDFQTFKKVFIQAKVSSGLSKELLIKVLERIKSIHDNGETNEVTEKHDLKLSISILEWVADQSSERTQQRTE